MPTETVGCLRGGGVAPRTCCGSCTEGLFSRGTLCAQNRRKRRCSCDNGLWRQGETRARTRPATMQRGAQTRGEASPRRSDGLEGGAGVFGVAFPGACVLCAWGVFVWARWGLGGRWPAASLGRGRGRVTDCSRPYRRRRGRCHPRVERWPCGRKRRTTHAPGRRRSRPMHSAAIGSSKILWRIPAPGGREAAAARMPGAGGRPMCGAAAAGNQTAAQKVRAPETLRGAGEEAPRAGSQRRCAAPRIATARGGAARDVC